MRELDRERTEQTYQSSRLETGTSGNRPRRSSMDSGSIYSISLPK